MFAAYYSFFDLIIVEGQLINHPEIQRESRFWTFVGFYDSIKEALGAAQFWQYDAITQAELEAYLNGDLEIF